MQIYNAVKACAMAVLYVTYIMSQRRVYKYSEAYSIIVPCAYVRYVYFGMKINCKSGVQWLSGRVLDLRRTGRGFKPHWRHCTVVLGQDTFVLA